MIYKALNGLGFTPPGNIASPVSHMIILLARFEHLNWTLISKKEIWVINKEQKRQASMFWEFLSA